MITKLLYSVCVLWAVSVAYPADTPSACIGNCTNGFGRKKLSDSERFYEGEFKNGLPHGKGKYTAIIGRRLVGYIGDWVAGQKHGHGTQHFHSGGRFVGTWKEDYKEGQGEFTSVLGHCDLYEAIHQYGYGTNFREFSDIPFDYCTFNGPWAADMPYGMGTLTLKFDILHVFSEKVFVTLQKMSFLSRLVTLKNYDTLPAKIQIAGTWKHGLPIEGILTVWDARGKIFYKETIKEITKQIPWRPLQLTRLTCCARCGAVAPRVLGLRWPEMR